MFGTADASKAPRICLAINSLRCGGAERVAATLANEWSRAGHQTSVITLAADLGFYPLDGRIERRGLDSLGPSIGLARGIAASAFRFRRLRQELRLISPDVIVSFLDCMNVLVLLAAAGLGIPVVVSERTDPRMAVLGLGWRALRRLTYPRAAALVVQTQSVAAWARGLVDPRRVVVLPNPIVGTFFPVEPPPRDRPRVRRIAALGRLSQEKGFDILIEAFARVQPRHPGWTLVIAGEGPLGGPLREQAGRAGVADRIEFTGLIRNPETLLADSEILVLASRREGFPNALLEGMACGCSVIATDCRSGPSEIIAPGIDGVLVPVENVNALADALDALMTDDAGRRRLGAAAALSAERFRAHGIAEQWIRLLTSVSGRSAAPAVSTV
jgi:glycosyltransferase involved in cell wall biosynthesis